MTVTVGIKALNEAENIAACLESALAAVAPFGGRVILADSGSTDGTVEIASRYPVTILQLARREDGCCGAGAQLAFQQAGGEYFYLLDGDMCLDIDMVRRGVAYLEAHPDVAGVGGHVIEQNLDGLEFQVRAQKAKAFRSGEVDRLDCGGLYRMTALRPLGYFADRNLHAFEEFDLGARLTAAGWKLARIDHPGVYHFGHRTEGYRLLWRRLRSGYTGGLGEVLRAAIGKPHLPVLLKRLRTLQMAMVVIGWWCALAVCTVAGAPVVALGLLVLPLVLLILRRRSVAHGLYSFASCNMLAIGLVSGFFRKRTSPVEPLAAREIAALVGRQTTPTAQREMAPARLDREPPC